MFLCWIPTGEKSNQELQWSFAFYQYLMNFRSGFSSYPWPGVIAFTISWQFSCLRYMAPVREMWLLPAHTASHYFLLSGSGCGSQSPGCTPNQHLFSREQAQLVFRQFAKVKEKMETFKEGLCLHTKPAKTSRLKLNYTAWRRRNQAEKCKPTSSCIQNLERPFPRNSPSTYKGHQDLYRVPSTLEETLT